LDMDWEFKRGLFWVLGVFLLGWPGLRSAVHFREEVNDVTSFLTWAVNSLVSVFSDPFTWCGGALVLIYAVICRDDLMAWWHDYRQYLTDHGVAGSGTGKQPGKDEIARLRTAKEMIEKLAASIPSPLPARSSPFFEMHNFTRAIEAIHGIPQRDWKSDTVASLRGLVCSKVVADYESCLTMPVPERAAKDFLAAKAAVLSFSDLSGYTQ
jgi:hypothetical protein